LCSSIGKLTWVTTDACGCTEYGFELSSSTGYTAQTTRNSEIIDLRCSWTLKSIFIIKQKILVDKTVIPPTSVTSITKTSHLLVLFCD
jgi:hypothetical protein